MTIKKYGKTIVVASVDITGGTASTWMAIVFQNLRHLHVTQAGGVVIDYLNAQTQPVVILPYLLTDDPVNADATAGYPDQSYYPGRPVRDGRGHKLSPGVIGTGEGSESTIRFTPWRFKRAGNAECTLLHELVHATEHVSGRLFTNKMGWNFDTQAEFDAIIVENMYRSEKGLDLRANHHGWDKMVGWLPVPDVAQYRRLLTSFHSRMPVLTDRLGQLSTSFNPFRVGAQGYVAL